METSIAVPDLKELQQVAAPIVTRAEALEVATKEQHEGGLLLLKDIKIGRKGIKGKIDPICKQANDLHKSLTGLRGEALKPWDHAEAITTGKLNIYESDQRAIAEQAAAEAEEEARKLEEERRLNEAIEAEAAGEDPDAILDEPVVAPEITVEPETAKVAGVSSRTTYNARVMDIVMLAKYVSEHPEWGNLIEANMSALNGLARSQRDAFKVPGCELVKNTVRSVRTA